MLSVNPEFPDGHYLEELESCCEKILELLAGSTKYYFLVCNDVAFESVFGQAFGP
jgi:hypothetical protein